MNEEEKRDRQMLELLNELRIALPGTQFLLAFLLTVPFSQRFSDVTSFQKTVFYASLLSTTAAVIFLIAPSATHRLRFHQRDRPFIIETANTYLIAGLVCLAFAIVLALIMVTDYLYDGWVVWAFPALLAVLLALVWFIRPLMRAGANARR